MAVKGNKNHVGFTHGPRGVTTNGQNRAPKNNACACGHKFALKSDAYTFEGCEQLRCRKCYLDFVEAA